MNAGPGRSIEPADPSIEVEEVPPGQELWTSVAASFALFGVDPGEAVEQLARMERDVLGAGGQAMVRDPRRDRRRSPRSPRC